MKILFLGDVMGRAGRRAVTETLPRLRRGYGADLVWVLDQLASGGTIRMNCGGDEFTGADGLVWANDRFFSTKQFSFSGARFFG